MPASEFLFNSSTPRRQNNKSAYLLTGLWQSAQKNVREAYIGTHYRRFSLRNIRWRSAVSSVSPMTKEPYVNSTPSKSRYFLFVLLIYWGGRSPKEVWENRRRT